MAVNTWRAAAAGLAPKSLNCGSVDVMPSGTSMELPFTLFRSDDIPDRINLLSIALLSLLSHCNGPRTWRPRSKFRCK